MTPRPSPDFVNAPLEAMVAVGSVGPRSVRLWARADAPGELVFRCWPRGDERRVCEASARAAEPADNTVGISLPDDAPGAPPLEPVTSYRFAVRRRADGRPLGEGRFETAPERPDQVPERFGIGLFSCHQPFQQDGSLAASSDPMLRSAREIFERHRVKLVLTVGDQVYTDWPKDLSLLDDDYFARVAPEGRERLVDCSAEQVRRLVQRRYRQFWSLEGWKALHASFPCLPILDDHDIIDNWGSDPDHDAEPWLSVGTGALAAYRDYQDSRVRPADGPLPDDFDHSVEYGPLAVHLLDLRSNRRAGEEGQLVSPLQLERLEAFLRQNGDKEVLGLVLSVPLVHLPRWVAKLVARSTPTGEDFSDRWSSLSHVEDRDRVIALLHEHQQRHPEQRLLLLSGDIHIGCVHRVRWRGSGRSFHQLISSGVTHAPSLPIQLASILSIRFNRRVATLDGRHRARVRLLRKGARPRRNPYRGLNVGVVEVRRPPGGGPLEVELLLYGKGGRCVYRVALPAEPSG